VLDAGTGMFRLAPHLLTDEVDILLSHSHLDHVVGLTYLLDVFHQRPMRCVRVWGQARFLAAIQTHVFNESIFPAMPKIDWCPLDGSSGASPGAQHRSAWKLTWFELEHPGGSTGFRLDWPDRSLAYITDTIAREHSPYADQLHGVDLLLHEAHFRDNRPELAERTGHSTIGAAVAMAVRSRVKRLALVHHNPLDDQASIGALERYRAMMPNLVVAEDRMEIEF
jgi:ribonuclease BN (tRNA processing enzyme)